MKKSSFLSTIWYIYHQKSFEIIIFTTWYQTLLLLISNAVHFVSSKITYWYQAPICPVISRIIPDSFLIVWYINYCLSLGRSRERPGEWFISFDLRHPFEILKNDSGRSQERPIVRWLFILLWPSDIPELIWWHPEVFRIIK